MPDSGVYKPILPTPDTIYYKDFHFLDEPLINKKHIRGDKNLSSSQQPEETGSEERQDTELDMGEETS